MFRFTVKGLVQGIGYRPFIANTLRELGYAGTVRNSGGIVTIEVNIDKQAADEFSDRLYQFYPEGAVIEKVDVEEVEGEIPAGVHILASDEPLGTELEVHFFGTGQVLRPLGTELEVHSASAGQVLLPVDLPPCEACVAEIRDPKNRRYRYPFNSCVACGPRYSIMRRTPYDRVNTSMGKYEMCPDCRREYLGEAEDKRRFYAQTISCPSCGMELVLDEYNEKPSGNVNVISDSKLSAEVENNTEVNLVVEINSDAKLKDEINKETKLKVKNTCDTVVNTLNGNRALARAIELLKAGQVLAVKDTGGYHFVCDGANDAAVSRLRKLKKREDKPFAVVTGDVEKASKLAEVSEQEARLLKSKVRPIVLLKRKDSQTSTNSTKNSDGVTSEVTGKVIKSGPASEALSSLVSLDSPYVGVMLPSSALFVILCDEFDYLVSTSANYQGSPIIIDDYQIQQFGLATLWHDRDILTPVDDSIMRVVNGRSQVLRRGRGLVPEEIVIDGELPGLKGEQTEKTEFMLGENEGLVDERVDDQAEKSKPTGRALNLGVDSSSRTLALGADLKGSFAYRQGNKVFMSQYFGDLAKQDNYVAMWSAIDRFRDNLRLDYDQVIVDKHPLYQSAKLGDKLVKQGNKAEVFHHQAHIASVAAEHGLLGDFIGFSLDGTSLGEDGSVWGGECFACRDKEYSHVGGLSPIRMTGGDNASLDPAISFSCFLAAMEQDDNFSLNNDDVSEIGTNDNGLSVGLSTEKYIEKYITRLLEKANSERKQAFTFDDYQLIKSALEVGINTIDSSSCGRLFDVVAMILGASYYNDYDARGPIKLEYMASNYLRSKEMGDDQGVRTCQGETECLNETGSHGMTDNSETVTCQSVNDIQEVVDGKNETCEGSMLELKILEKNGKLYGDSAKLVKDIIGKVSAGVKPEELAVSFHRALARWIAGMAVRTCKEHLPGCKRVALSGGCFSNRLLLEMTCRELEKESFEVYFNCKVPPTDESIAFGQVWLGGQ